MYFSIYLCYHVLRFSHSFHSIFIFEPWHFQHFFLSNLQWKTRRQTNLEGFFSTFNSITHTRTHTDAYCDTSSIPFPSLIICWKRIHASILNSLGYQSVCLAFCVSWKVLRWQDLRHVKKKKHIHKKKFKNESPRAPKPLPSILSRPLSCASDKKRWPNEEKQEEQRLKRIRGNSQGEIQQPRCWGETCDVAAFFFFF